MAAPRTDPVVTRNKADRTRVKPAKRDRLLRIVMADDDHNDQLLMSMAADTAGLDAEFTFHDDGSMLLFRLEQMIDLDTLPDLIVLDLRMPGLDGHRTLDELQAHPVLWQIPVVVFSSSTRRIDQTTAFAKGAHWFETKPSDFDGMVAFALSLAERAAHAPYDFDLDEVSVDVSQTELVADIEEFLLDQLDEEF